MLTFQELPDEAQADVLLQFEDDFNIPPMECGFELVLITHDQLLMEMDNRFGANLTDVLELDEVKELSEEIFQMGLKNPPVGSEGVHRTLAHIILGYDMPRYEIIYPNTYNS